MLIKKMKMMQEAKTSDSELNVIRQTCMRLLAMREHSQFELIQKLQLRGFASPEIDLVLQEMISNGWQDDQRYAESYVRQRITKGYGPLKIAYELRSHGVEHFDLDDFVDELAGGWSSCLLNLYQHKFDNKQNLTRQEWSKRYRFLQQRGFSPGLIRQLFAQLKLNLGS